MDAYLRAFDAAGGAELWRGRLPVPGVANPMTYEWKGEQYVVIAAGGHSEAETSLGDSVAAFRLARPGEAPSLRARFLDQPGGRFRAVLAAMLLALAGVGLIAWRLLRRR
jgi:quinoprotein glucose dehydrogenase